MLGFAPLTLYRVETKDDGGELAGHSEDDHDDSCTPECPASVVKDQKIPGSQDDTREPGCYPGYLRDVNYMILYSIVPC